MVKKGLGKGLQALIPMHTEDDIEGEKVKEIKISQLKPNAFQPRRFFDEEKLKELADSIKEHGVVQPILVRSSGKDAYEIVAGERRWRAAKKAALEVVPVVIKEYDDREMTEIALIENIQRENLNPIEEAQAYKKLMEEFGLTQEKLSLRVGKSRPFIANIIRLLNLHPSIQDFLSRGLLTAGHARPLLGIENKENQFKLAEEIINKNLSVRQTEQAIKSQSKKQTQTNPKVKEQKREAIYLQIEEKMRSLLGTQVKVKDLGEKGKIEIEYYSEEDLTRIIELLLRDEKF